MNEGHRGDHAQRRLGAAASGMGGQPEDAPRAALDARLLAEVVVGLWRARATMTDASTGEPRAEVRHAYLHVQAVWDMLAGAGIEAQCHDGMAYDPGLSITAVAFRPVPGLAREEVVETLRPTVYLSGRMLAQGEVVVGTPVPHGDPGPGGGRQL